MNIEITRESMGGDGLQQRQVWGWYVISQSYYSEGVRVVADSYREEVRISNRHKWRAVRGWSRLSWNWGYAAKKLRDEEIPPPPTGWECNVAKALTKGTTIEWAPGDKK